MSHLNLTLMHPFSDGNGRTARCLQTAVLTKEGIAAPDFSSIEEYIGRNQQEYYDILASTGGGKWSPDRNCKPWVRFCITGHYRQAQTLIRRSREMSQVYEELVNETNKYGLHERTALAHLEAASPSRVRNASYRVSAGVSNNLASRDLKVSQLGTSPAFDGTAPAMLTETSRMTDVNLKSATASSADRPFPFASSRIFVGAEQEQSTVRSPVLWVHPR